MKKLMILLCLVALLLVGCNDETSEQRKARAQVEREELIDQCYKEGYDDGYADGYSDGYDRGYRAAKGEDS